MSSDMPSVLYNDDGDERVVFTLPSTTNKNADSVLVFAMPKSGSVLLDRIMRDLTPHVGLTYVSIMEEFFNLGIPDNLFPPTTEGIFLPRGYCYGGFRYFPRKFEIPIVPLPSVKKILLMRDVRDMLVSHYFSMLNSHPSRGAQLKSSEGRMKSRDLAGELEINGYVRRMSKRFSILMTHYKRLCEDEDVRVFRYEDVVYDKAKWIEDICTYFEWDVSESARQEIAARHDHVPEAEDENQHIRQVHPGNYKKKLEPDTIAELNDYFAEEMKFFGYDI